MLFEIQTIVFVASLTFITQFIALSVQYFVNRTYRGVKWWLLGSCLWMLGMLFMPLISDKSLYLLARVANPLTVLGQLFLYVGIIKFLDQKPNRPVLISIYAAFLLVYYYFMFGENSISGRSLVISITLAILLFMSAYKLIFNKDKRIYGSANFTAVVFIAFGCFSAMRFLSVIFSPPVQQYSDQSEILILSFIVPLVVSLLWTFGFIIMLNQRLYGEIREEKEKLQLIFNTSPDAAIISRLSDGLIVDVNSGFEVMTGFSRAELINNTIPKIEVWHKLSDRVNFINEIGNKGKCENREFVFQKKNGSLFDGNISARIITINAEPHIISVVQDITQRKQAEEALRESEEMYRSILTASPDDITITDMKGRILVTSPAANIMFGFGQYDQVIGTQLLDYILPEERERARANIISLCKGELTGPNEYKGLRKDQSIFDIEVNSGLIHDANGQPAKMVFVVRDISERKQADQQIQQLIHQLEIEKSAAQLNAVTDSLTGLPNRRYFDEALSTEFHRLKRSGFPMSLIMLDVDHFKKYNDHYGHLAGDECLRQIGIILKSMVGRATDVVARYGGEEFVAILTDTDHHGAATLAERIRQAVQDLAIPHANSSIAEVVTVSLGVVTVYTTGLASPEQIVAMADEAMYSAKKEGRNRVSISTKKTNLLSQ